MNKLKSILMKHRKLLGPIGLALAVAAIFWVVNSPSIVGVSASAKQLPVYCVQRDNKAVSLTFDAAWGNEATQTLIDTLNKYGVKATFFLVGQWVDKYPESVKALADAGMEIGNHSDDHPHMAKLSEKQIIDEVSLCSGKIEAITGGEVKLFRCPYGEYDDQVITTIENMGVQPIQWDVERSHTGERSWRWAICRREKVWPAARYVLPVAFVITLISIHRRRYARLTYVFYLKQ